MSDFDLAYANEAMAKSLVGIGKPDEVRPYFENALLLAETIQNPEDKSIFMEDFNSGD
jgi:hypothetical protein